MEKITNKRGYELVQFSMLKDEKQIDPAVHSPLIASLVVTIFQNKILLVYDRYKQSWELPGGGIEAGEEPRACAMRELYEESGQSITDLDFIGLAEIVLHGNNRHWAAIYLCHLDNLSTFLPNSEIEKIVLWDFKSDIGYVDEIDLYLAKSALKN